MKKLSEEQAINYLVGQAMKTFKAQNKVVSPVMVKKIIEEILEEMALEEAKKEILSEISTQGLDATNKTV